MLLFKMGHARKVSKLQINDVSGSEKEKKQKQFVVVLLDTLLTCKCA